MNALPSDDQLALHSQVLADYLEAAQATLNAAEIGATAESEAELPI